MIATYQRDGFVRVPNLISREEALAFREAALRVGEKVDDLSKGSAIFAQFVNVWTKDEDMKHLTMHPNVADAAQTLADSPLRLWHDQILIKAPGTSKATHFHQDQPYWPHLDSPNPISCWIALGDVPVESGCMTFIPGQQHRTELRMQNLADERSLFEIAPDLTWAERVTVPLQAGDATFHHGRCPHMATPNLGDSPRVAHVVIFMDAKTRFSGAGHVVTDPLGLSVGDKLAGERFPKIGNINEFTDAAELQRIDEATLALLSLGRHDEDRVWKSFSWDSMERLHEKGYISNPHGTAKSVVITPEGSVEAERLFQKMFR